MALGVLDASAVALITASILKRGEDPRWYVRHGWIVGALVLFALRAWEGSAMRRLAAALYSANGGHLPAGAESLAPYLPKQLQPPAGVPGGGVA